MPAPAEADDRLLFADDDNGDDTSVDGEPWKLLIVDDEPAVHDVTRMALHDVVLDQRRLELLHAYSATEAAQLLQAQPDIAIAMVDVVMEHEHAGLDLVRQIREDMGNRLIRLILRTGQPGHAPERTVIHEYDINDYKEKNELSSQKLYSAVYSALRSYRDLMALEENRRGLTRVLDASCEIFKFQKLAHFTQGVLEQLVSVLDLDRDSVFVNAGCCALQHKDQRPLILAGTGRYADSVGQEAASALPASEMALIEQAIGERRSLQTGRNHISFFSPAKGRDHVLYFTRPAELSAADMALVELFSQNVSIAYNNLVLNQELEETQREMVYLLGEAIESHSRETGSHVKRVAEYCRILGEAAELPEREVEVLVAASPLHDFGKICVPDAVLHKPGKLDAEEWAVMQQHAKHGEDMLSRSERGIIQAAAIIAGQHHERWDGAGYPKGLSGTDIHLYARIVCLADVYDALSSKRCYKVEWNMDQVHAYVREQRGAQFDPTLVDLLFDNLERFAQVRLQFPDE